MIHGNTLTDNLEGQLLHNNLKQLNKSFIPIIKYSSQMCPHKKSSREVVSMLDRENRQNMKLLINNQKHANKNIYYVDS